MMVIPMANIKYGLNRGVVDCNTQTNMDGMASKRETFNDTDVT